MAIPWLLAHHSPTLALAVLWLVLFAALAGAFLTRATLPPLIPRGGSR